MCTGYPPAYRRADMDVHRQHLGDMVHAGKTRPTPPSGLSSNVHTLIDRYRLALNGPQATWGIEGNEAADELANTGANEGRTDDDRSAEPTISGIGTTAKALADIATSDWWSQLPPRPFGSYRRWKPGYSVTEPQNCASPHSATHRLLATRHGTRRFRAVPQKVRPHRSGAHLPLRVREGSRPPRILARSPNASLIPGWLDPNVRPAAPRKGGDTKCITSASRALRKLSRGNPVLRHQCPCTANVRSDNFGWFPYKLRLAETKPPLFNRYLANRPRPI
ncbi:hypothetical protein DID88_002023 [Monilinia fructigena]|uniref:RNase H type-1 domain-containing protein n=1 Tax=Monilinia fructigena TaxID=38457 RepID=A0A395J1M9_9HELO|nr:hypothetical protein DID88_002023 [Monilinia fructigena]